MIYVTHDQVEAMTLADRIVVLNEGRVQQIGSPLDLYKRPANLFVASFIGSPKMNLLASRVEARTASGVEVSLPSGAPLKVPLADSDLISGDKITIGVRPQALEVSEQGHLSGEIALIERLGSETNVKIKLASGDVVLAVLSGDTTIQQGDRVTCRFALEDILIFDKAGNACRSSHLEI